MSARFHLLKPPTPRHDPDVARAALLRRAPPPALHDHDQLKDGYVLDEPTRLAVNTALVAGAPLLVTGEPGTGKTQLAAFLGWYFGLTVFKFVVRSTSTAEQLKYDYDAVAYLRDAQSGGRPRARSEFLVKKALWQAFEHPEPAVLLIDEIDKAPRDFPNDLLQELDQLRFRHPFEDRDVLALHPPVVVITSNAERRLPDAFLRRCVHHPIRVDEAFVERVIAARLGDFPRLDADRRAKAMERFFELRRRELRKPPSVGELLVWMAVLSAREVGLDELGKPLRELPSLGALVKDEEDLEAL